MKFLNHFKDLRFQIKIDIDAFNDIQETFEWHEMHLKGLGLRYKTETKKQINSLQKGPYLVIIKYNEIRFRKIKKFPFLIHYTIDASLNIITILGVFHTSRNPEIWKKTQK